MPIFMDRHDVFETVTAEIVAQIHQEDLKIQDQFSCRGLTYWFDDQRKTAFCLIEAPDAEAIKKMHAKAHGDVPHMVIEVDTKLVEAFLGRIEDPVQTPNTAQNIIIDPAFRTLMVISLAKSYAAPERSREFKSSLQQYGQAILVGLRAAEGSVVRQNEKHFLVSFSSVTNAVRAAVEIQSLFTNDAEKAPGNIDLKIGLSTGVPVAGKDQIFEDTIKLADRMCRVGRGQIVVSPEVKELYNGENAIPLNEETILCLTEQDETFLTMMMDHLESVWTNTNLKVDDFSKPVGCSKSQLYRKLVLLTGKSPNSFIREYRLDEALVLLGKNKLTISEIAFETGFSSLSYFSKCFQKRFNHLPSDYLS
jgi:AraC-like DNA-binding protein